MPQNQHDRAKEIFVRKLGHGNQQFSIKRFQETPANKKSKLGLTLANSGGAIQNKHGMPNLKLNQPITTIDPAAIPQECITTQF